MAGLRQGARTPPQPSPAGATDRPLALIWGGVSVPLAVAEAALRRCRRVVLFPVRGWANAADVEPYPHHWISLVQGGRFLRYARAEGCRDVVFIGTAVRPPLRSLRIDWT